MLVINSLGFFCRSLVCIMLIISIIKNKLISPKFQELSLFILNKVTFYTDTILNKVSLFILTQALLAGVILSTLCISY